MTAICAIPPAAFACARFFEGLSLDAYRDPVGLWTQGYGHLLTRNKAERTWPRISHADAENWLRQDMTIAARAIAPLIKVPSSPGQWGALVDFAFNLGAAKLRASTLLSQINARAETKDILFQFGRWTYGGGRCLTGLRRRRAGEAMLWTTGNFSHIQFVNWLSIIDG